MPVTKLPVVHKFGIISHSQRLDLQDRLLKQSYIQGFQSKKATLSAAKNPLEVSDEFVQHFNNARNYHEKEKFEDLASKMLERSKRRAGLRDRGTGHHVNLPLAWTELAQLSQCKGKQQEECLDVLITSLEISPLERYHIPALFFLAETMLYWLRTESIHQPYLRTTEIKLLKMGQLVFTRLFYSHMAGQLQGHLEFKNRLFTYLDGLPECQEAYNPYPNALLSLRFIIEVGKIILADTRCLDRLETRQSDKVPPGRNVEELTQATKQLYEKRSETSTHSAAISSSVHDLSPTLWHSLDVWRCTNQLSGGTADALVALAHCGLGLATENWIDGTIALLVLGDAAKCDSNAMKALHCLACGVKVEDDRVISPTLSSHSQSSVTDFTFSDEGDLENKLISAKQSVLSSRPSLSDINEKSEDGYRSSSQSNSKYTSGTSPVPPLDLSATEEDSPLPALREIKAPRMTYKREVSFDTKIQSKLRSDKNQNSNDKEENNQENKQLDDKENDKSQFDPATLCQGRMSSVSSVGTYTNIPLPDSAGIFGWHWEVAVTYCDILANICIHGNNVNIQKMALVGVNVDISEPYRRGYGIIPLVSAGLIDLAFFHTMSDGGAKDWSWRLRYGAIQSLVKICRCLANDNNREGMRNAAWSTLLKAHSVEKDHRVLEALKVGQVHTNIDEMLKLELHLNPSSIGYCIANGLTSIYLPPLPPPVTVHLPNKPPARRLPQVKATPRTRAKLRTSLKDEIMLATALYEEPVNFNTRTSFDLRRIVEDQWRKELQEQLEQEEEEKKKELEEKQRNEEELQKEKDVSRALKLSKNTPQIVK